MRPCFKFSAFAAGKPTHLLIEDEIGFWGVQAKDFRAQLSAVAGNELVVEVNSPGGEVFAGLGIYNMLRSWAAEGDRTLTTRVGALAASIASVIVLAGDKREMPANAFVMIHEPSGFAAGTESDLREAADVIAKIKGSMRNLYMSRLGVDEAKADALLSKDSWLTADECLAMGVATEVTDAVTVTASFDTARLELPAGATLFKATAPTKPKQNDNPVPPPAPGGVQPALVPKTEPSQPKTDPEPKQNDNPVPPPAPGGVQSPPVVVEDAPLHTRIEALCASDELRAYADDLVLACETFIEAQARASDIRQISALCKAAARVDDVTKYVRAGTSVRDVRAALLKARADEDPQIDSAPPATKPTPVATEFQPTAVWAKHTAQNAKKGR